MNSIRQSIAESTFSNWSGQTWPRDEKESWQVHEQFHWTLQSGVIMEWVVTQKTVPPSEFGHGSCGSFKTESVWSSGQWSVWTVRPRTVSVTSEGRASDHVYCGPVLPDSKRRPGPNSSETSTRSRKLSASLVIKKTFRHEDIQTWRFSDMKTFKHEDFQMWWPASKKATLLPEDPPARRSSN